MNRPNASTNEHNGHGKNRQPRFLQEDALDMAVTDVLCEAEGLTAAERVFFVAGDDDDVGEEGPAIDFNVLADTEESVAEVIGEVAAKRPAAEAPAEEPLEEEPLAEVAGSLDVVSAADAVMEAEAAEIEAEVAAVGEAAEPEAVVEAAPEAAEPEPAVLAVAADSSSGEYLPASPVVAAIAASEPGPIAAPAPVPAPALEIVQEATPEAAPPTPSVAPREQRNRERARRKKEKRAAKAAARANKLPEIVLARSEGTDTLLPEAGEMLAVVSEAADPEAAADIPALSAAALEAALFEPDALAAALELAPAVIEPAALIAAPAPAALAESPAPTPAQPRGPVRSLITPIDIISDSPDIVADSATQAEVPEAAMPEATGPAAELAEPGDSPAADASPDRALLLSAESDALRLDAYSLLDDANAAAQTEEAEEADAEDAMNNVILFRPAFLQAEDSLNPEDLNNSPDAGYSPEQDSAYAPPRLRLLPPVEENSAADAAAVSEDGENGEAAAVGSAAVLPLLPPEPALSSAERLALLRAIAGSPDSDVDADASAADSASEAAPAAADAEAENVILFRGLYTEPVDPDAELARARAEIAAELSAELSAEITARMSAEMEQTLQARADEFALRLLEVEAAAVEVEGRARASVAELLEKERAAATLAAEKEKEAAAAAAEAARLAEELKSKDERLAASATEIAGRDSRLRRFDGLQDEHEKLYTQFEDLRTAYNEIVTSAMPGLQAERDDFALTVERQVDEMDSLKSSLSGARRRLAVGYSMAAAAAIMIVSLPVAGWLGSGTDERAAARDRQEVAELRDRADEAERQTLAAGETIIELERKLNLAAAEFAKLETRNGELSRRGREIAARAVPAIPGGGTPTRTSTMALQATPAPGGELRVNEIRDPAGSIEQVYADNRTRREQAEGPQMAAASSSGASGRIAVSAVARAGSAARSSGKPGASLRPSSDRADQAAAAGRTASVRAGEGVAQVVYRVMGTRDPEVINWVIRENGIKTDRRGNPRIYPEQQLRLPSRMEQTASR